MNLSQLPFRRMESFWNAGCYAKLRISLSTCSNAKIFHKNQFALCQYVATTIGSILSPFALWIVSKISSIIAEWDVSK